MKKVCLFGDSISKGVIYDEACNRYKMTKECFANLISKNTDELEIKNYSMFGCSIEKGISLLERHNKTVKECDIVVLEYGGNDSDHNWQEIAETPELEHNPKTPINLFLEDYEIVIKKLQDMGKQVVMLNLPPIDEHRYFNWFSQGLNKENILKWLGGSEEYIYRFHESYDIGLQKIASRFSIPLIDIRSEFLLKKDYREYLCCDGIHPNEKGHNLIAQIIAKNIPIIKTSIFGSEIYSVPALG